MMYPEPYSIYLRATIRPKDYGAEVYLGHGGGRPSKPDTGLVDVSSKPGPGVSAAN